MESASKLIISLVNLRNPLIQKVLRFLATGPDDIPIGVFQCVGPIVTSALYFKVHAYPHIPVSTETALALVTHPKKTDLCRSSGPASLPDIMCSTDGLCHDYGTRSDPNSPVNAAAKLLRPLLFRDAIMNVPRELCQYRLLGLAGFGFIYLSILNYHLMQRTGELIHVPVTLSSNTVIPNTEILFPLIFHRGKVSSLGEYKCSFLNHPAKLQQVYRVKLPFDIVHQSLGNQDRLSADKKSVFLTRKTFENNLEPIAKTLDLVTYF